jgi:hypothetical protein
LSGNKSRDGSGGADSEEAQETNVKAHNRTSGAKRSNRRAMTGAKTHRRLLETAERKQETNFCAFSHKSTPVFPNWECWARWGSPPKPQQPTANGRHRNHFSLVKQVLKPPFSTNDMRAALFCLLAAFVVFAHGALVEPVHQGQRFQVRQPSAFLGRVSQRFPTR